MWPKLKRGYFFLLVISLGNLLVRPVTSFAAGAEEVQDAFAPAIQAAEKTTVVGGRPVAVKSAELRLEAISIGQKNAVAIINGELYQQGEEKNGIQVVQIRKHDADIITTGISETLKLHEEDKTAMVGLGTAFGGTGNQVPQIQEDNEDDFGKTEGTINEVVPGVNNPTVGSESAPVMVMKRKSSDVGKLQQAPVQEENKIEKKENENHGVKS